MLIPRRVSLGGGLKDFFLNFPPGSLGKDDSQFDLRILFKGVV